MLDLSSENIRQILMKNLEAVALAAAPAIMEIYRSDFDVEHKGDHSPVTIADKKGEDIILRGLSAHYADIPVVAEESASAGVVPKDTGAEFFLVDPLDGTKEFIKKSDEFTINIGLVQNGVPVAGVVIAPAKYAAWVGCGNQAEKIIYDDSYAVLKREAISVRVPPENLKAVVSASHLDEGTKAYLDKLNVTEYLKAGSSLKLCLVAEGVCDIYPRLAPTMLWDTAAADAVLRSAGGAALKMDGADLMYDPMVTLKNPFFVAIANENGISNTLVNTGLFDA